MTNYERITKMDINALAEFLSQETTAAADGCGFWDLPASAKRWLAIEAEGVTDND